MLSSEFADGCKSRTYYLDGQLHDKFDIVHPHRIQNARGFSAGGIDPVKHKEVINSIRLRKHRIWRGQSSIGDAKDRHNGWDHGVKCLLFSKIIEFASYLCGLALKREDEREDERERESHRWTGGINTSFIHHHSFTSRPLTWWTGGINTSFTHHHLFNSRPPTYTI